MSFYHLPHPWNPGYAIPEYIMAEPPGRGVFTTKWLPRGTISQLTPDFLAKSTAKKVLGREDAQLGSLSGDTLGAKETVYKLEPLGATGRVDPIRAYGEQAAKWIMGTIHEVDPGNRTIALRALLDSVDIGLWDSVAKHAGKYKAQGMAPKAAMQKALAVCLSSGMAKEIVTEGE
jgi:hypothetical protein